jgi:diguanylate cyclase (GGDEF)-like protein
MLTNGKQEELCIKGHHGLDVAAVRETRIKVGESISGVIAQNGNGVLVFDIEKDERFLLKNKPHYQSKSFLSVPIRLGDRLIGVINVSEKKSEQEPAFTELDLKILKMIARQVAVAIETARVSRELKHLQVTDSLTDLYNYRHFTTILDNEIKSLKRYPGTLSLTMILVATRSPLIALEQRDPLLRQVGKDIQDHLREVDTVCRYAGNEFVVVLPNTNANEAHVAAVRIKDGVEKQFRKAKVQLSMGIAEYAPGLDRYELIVRANSALFQAKKDVEDKICIFNQPKF